MFSVHGFCVCGFGSFSLFFFSFLLGAESPFFYCFVVISFSISRGCTCCKNIRITGLFVFRIYDYSTMSAKFNTSVVHSRVKVCTFWLVSRFKLFREKKEKNWCSLHSPIKDTIFVKRGIEFSVDGSTRTDFNIILSPPIDGELAFYFRLRFRPPGTMFNRFFYLWYESILPLRSIILSQLLLIIVE